MAKYSIVLLTAKSFVGKDTIAKAIPELIQVSVGTVMKKAFMEQHPNINLFDRATKEAHRTDLMAFTHQTPLIDWVKRTPYTSFCIVTDIRTLTEINYIKSKFSNVMVVRLTASNVIRANRGWRYNPEFDDSYLENELNDYPCDLTLVNEEPDDIVKCANTIRGYLMPPDPYFTDIGYGIRMTAKPFNGIPFCNIVKMLANPTMFNSIIETISLKLNSVGATHIMGLESGGYPLAAALAYKMGIGFVFSRKPGKLPPPVITINYSMEYRPDNQMELQSDALDSTSRVIIVDDIIVTGGTIKGAIKLAEMAGAKVVAIAAYGSIDSIDSIDKKFTSDVPIVKWMAIVNGIANLV